MAKSSLVREPQNATTHGESVVSETVDYRSQLEKLSRDLSFEQAVIITTLPRGSLQICQPARVNDALLKDYTRDYHLHDRPSWEAIARQHAVRGMDCWPQGQLETSPYMAGFLRAHGLRYVMAAPLAAPVLDGYPGVIKVLRTSEQQVFNAENQRTLQTFARQLDDVIERSRKARSGSSRQAAHYQHPTDMRVFVFDPNMRARIGEAVFNRLDRSLQQNMLDLARQRFGQVNGKQTSTDRVSLPDARGDLWNFRVVVHAHYPALGDGPFVFFCIQPECGDWGLIRANDFAADPEIARLIPALKFMQENFSRGPTLHEIAKVVHLSPFHFHRRFTELLGITPKHFLLDCQIQQAKEQLVKREKELAEIATECGFAHQSHFTSRFKQATGLTPTRWRRLAAESKA